MRDLSTLPRDELEAIVGRVQTELYREGTGWNPDKEVNGGNLVQELGSILAQHDLAPAQNTHYLGPPFSRDQLVFVVWAAIAAALDQFSGTMPDDIEWADRKNLINGFDRHPTRLVAYERGAIGALAMNLAILAAQLTDDGVGRDDALAAAGNIGVELEAAVKTAWQAKGKDIRGLPATERSRAVRALLPDARACAERFVDTMLHDYLRKDIDDRARG